MANNGANGATEEELYITKRDGTKEVVSFDKILKRVKALGTSVAAQASVAGTSTSACAAAQAGTSA